MKNEHKTLKWCAVVAALIVSIASIAGMWFLPVSGHMILPYEGSAITRVPEEMPVLPDSEDLEQLRNDYGESEQSEFAMDSAESSELQESGQQGPTASPATGEIESGQKSPADAPATGKFESGQQSARIKPGTTGIKTGEQQAYMKPVNITVNADGMEMHLLAAPFTIEQVLDSYSIPVGENDIVEPALDRQITEGTVITIQRVVFEEVTVKEDVAFKTKVKGTDKLPAKTEKVVQEGVKGIDEVTYKIKYVDGKEVEKTETARKAVKKPVTEIIEKSTVGTIEGKEYSRKFTVKAYSYTGGGRTASGLPAAVGRIAVDPRVIPLGTRVYVEGYGFATAADTGGNIKGNTIDVYYNSASQCRSWGCRTVTVYILK